MARVLALFLAAGVGFLAVLLTGGDRREAAAAPAARPAGTIVLTFGTNRLVAVDVAGGRRTVRRVPALATCGPQMHVTGGRVVFAGVRRGRTTVFSAPVSLDRRPTLLGEAHAFVPSATAGRVWLVGVDCDRPVMQGAREVGVDGRTARASALRVAGSWLVAAVSRGLVVQRSRELVVWDPGTGRTGPPLALQAVVAAHGDRLAGCLAGPDCDELAILDAATGSQVPVVVDRRYEVDLAAAFSPDGSWLAVPVRGAEGWRVALVDSRTGRGAIVPGLLAREYAQLSWSPSSGWLFLRTGARRMMAYRPGAPRAVTLPWRLPRRAIAYVAG